MEDSQIIDLYWARSEQAIAETSAKYGAYCYSIAYNILASPEDANECVSDTYLGVWNSIPPHRPTVFSAFLGKITRRISINRWKSQTRQKRGGGETALALHELTECIPSPANTEALVELKELAQAINGFLATLPETQRDIFVSRYWFFAPVGEIGNRFGFSQSKVKSILFRTRKKLRTYLQKEGLL